MEVADPSEATCVDAKVIQQNRRCCEKPDYLQALEKARVSFAQKLTLRSCLILANPTAGRTTK